MKKSVYYAGVTDFPLHSGGENAEIAFASLATQGRFRRFPGSEKGVAIVLLSERDVAVLRLLCWCQYIATEDMNSIFTNAEITNLALAGFLKRHEKSGAYVLARNGFKLLPQIFDMSYTPVAQSYHEYAIQRRLRISKLIITAYRAGLNVFVSTPEALVSPVSLYRSSITRGRGADPWGSTRIAALAHLGNLLCGCYFIYPGVGKLSLTDELTAFNNQTSHIKGVDRAFLFAGESYKTVLSELRTSASKVDSKLLTYGDAYRNLNLPVHLLSCDDIGATQLQLMAIPDYRRVLTQAALVDQYQPSPKEIPAWDAILDGNPFVMAADMDLRRIDAALETAESRGYAQVTLACLEEQARAALISRYQTRGVRFVRLTRETLTKALGHPPALYTPPRTQYLTEKGDVIDVPLIQAAGKTGKAHRKAGGRHRS